MEDNKNGFTAEGRKLRQRRPRIGTAPRGERVGNFEREGNYYERSNNSYERRPRSNNYEAYSSDRPKRNSYSQGYNSDRSRSYNSNGRSEYGNSRRASYSRDENYERRSEGRYNRNEGGYGRGEYGRNEGYGRSQGSYGRPRTNRPYNREQGDGDFRPNNRGQRGSSRFGSNNNRFGGKPKINRRPNKNLNEGIMRMVKRKPIISDMPYSDNDYVQTPIKDEIRLNKFIANSGVCSRREADQLIEAGVISVNGEVVTELGKKVNIHNDEVRYDGQLIKGEEKVYIVMNKPKGYVTTASDPHAERTVMDLLKNCKTRVFPVGRLDKNTTGVLMFTNDGDIADVLTHPSYDKKKIYQVGLDRPLAQEDFIKITEGITLGDGTIQSDALEYVEADDHRKIGIEIHSGKNRIVRRIFESLGYDVKTLDRVYFAGLTKKGLKKGEWRYLNEGEANLLKMGAYI